MRKNKVLIIGAKGMLGQELVKIFRRDKDYKVIAWDKEELDITDENQVNEKIGEFPPKADQPLAEIPELIINAAAYNAVDEAESKKGNELAKKINGLAPGYLASAAIKIKATLVHYSSDYVFDGDLGKLLSQEPAECTHFCARCNLHQNRDIGYSEDSKPNPINKYGKSKLMGEKEVAKNTKNYYIIRLSKLFGKPAKSKTAKKKFL